MTPPVMRWLVERVAAALLEAAKAVLDQTPTGWGLDLAALRAAVEREAGK